MKPRLYDSAAMAKIGDEVRRDSAGFRANLEAALASMRVARLNALESASWRLIRRFVGPRCPSDAADALTCVNLMGCEMTCTVECDGSSTFVIRRGAETLDSEHLPKWAD